MSSLKSVEKRAIEDLFGMQSGYVLDFTNQTFAEYFREAANVDIYSDKYAFNGDSKAKRLRAFWEIESDAVVAKVLAGLLEIHGYSGSKAGFNTLSRQYEIAAAAVARLAGNSHNTMTDQQAFLSQPLQNVSIKNVPIEPTLIPVLESRVQEALQCVELAPLATIIMCGSVLEGVLLGIAQQRQKDFNQARSSPKSESGKVKPYHEWSLAQFIDVAYEVGALKLDVKKFSHELRDFRNYIHPYQQLVARFEPDRHTAEICMQVLRAAIADLSGARN